MRTVGWIYLKMDGILWHKIFFSRECSVLERSRVLIPRQYPHHVAGQPKLDCLN